MRKIEDLFDEAVSAAPPSRLTAAGVFRAADRRRLRTAVAAGAAVVLVGVVVVLVGVGGRDAANPPVGGGRSGSLVWAGRGDASHLYRLIDICGTNPRIPVSFTPTVSPPATPAPCNQLWASGDGGATWSARGLTVDQDLKIVGVTSLLRYVPPAEIRTPAVALSEALWELSTDAGATWTRVPPDGPPLDAIPPGGVVAFSAGPTTMMVFDPVQGRLRPLVHAPNAPNAATEVITRLGTSTTLWSGGADPAGRQTVTVSHDGGATWTHRALPIVTARGAYHPYIFGIVSRDGTKAYVTAYDDDAAVRTPLPIPGTEGWGWFRVFKTVDGGLSWREMGDSSAAVAPSFVRSWVTADGRLVLLLNPGTLYGPELPEATTGSTPRADAAAAAAFAVSDDGREFRVASPPGLPAGLFDVDGSVAYSDHAMYVSDDGWTWHEAWHD